MFPLPSLKNIKSHRRDGKDGSRQRSISLIIQAAFEAGLIAFREADLMKVLGRTILHLSNIGRTWPSNIIIAKIVLILRRTMGFWCRRRSYAMPFFHAIPDVTLRYPGFETLRLWECSLVSSNPWFLVGC